MRLLEIAPVRYPVPDQKPARKHTHSTHCDDFGHTHNIRIQHLRVFFHIFTLEHGINLEPQNSGGQSIYYFEHLIFRPWIGVSTNYPHFLTGPPAEVKWNGGRGVFVFQQGSAGGKKSLGNTTPLKSQEVPRQSIKSKNEHKATVNTVSSHSREFKVFGRTLPWQWDILRRAINQANLVHTSSSGALELEGEDVRGTKNLATASLRLIVSHRRRFIYALARLWIMATDGDMAEEEITSHGQKIGKFRISYVVKYWMLK